jgi:hypothetical protein
MLDGLQTEVNAHAELTGASAKIIMAASQVKLFDWMAAIEAFNTTI